MKKNFRRAAKLALIAVLVYYFPLCMAVLFACGIYDVARNTALTADTLERYFLGNGVLTWLLSPFNVVLDLLALPFLNKGIYQIEDFPPEYQAEIRRVIDTAYRVDLVGRLRQRAEAEARAMFFFKWYGANIETFLELPAYHERFRYIQTIGVSVFNKRESTSKHFGPLRPTLRILYNLNDMPDRSAFIRVGGTVQYWQDKKLFIFDDTLQHQSFNESDYPRYCMFIDIVRPAAIPAALRGVVRLTRYLLKSVKFIFYKNWKVIAK